MLRSEIETKVRGIVEENLGVEAPGADSVIWTKDHGSDLDADSLDFVEYVMTLEETFGVDISDDDAPKLSSITKTVDYLADRLGAR